MEHSILCFTALINAAPLLREIILKLVLFWSSSPRRAQRAAIGQKHECLKVMKIEDFCHIAVDVEMALFVFDHATLLEKVVINGVVAETGEDLRLLKNRLLAKYSLLQGK